MRTSDEGVIALIGHEGIVPGPYLDSVKVLTYGVGHTAAAGSPDPARMAPGMPDDLDAELVRVFDVFRRDLEKYEAAVAKAITVPVEQHEFDAAVSFHFNTGAIHRASWVKSLNAGDRAKAVAQIMNWTKPREIIPRRQSEQELFATGKYPAQGVTVWTVTPDKRVKWVPARRLEPQEALALLRGAVRPDSEVAHESAAPSIWSAIINAILSLFGKGQK
ncbi:lysozyme [Phaeobacter gallaeciensis]|uniref:lysozyme n=1 Tax=Phaeobacter gallaeciensis TaxID=60890 RepID=UPI002380C34C|nr:lysozyme [Phaeobacter gallaeciensis]MDE4272675.1 lysozyme [Phaeobacter gallaeciensis]MDE4298372.1 lysozyme [Phaeobacter gallaeciensis]MDE5183560.1 lysozyme [Phaeobacter gallaeciensis]